MHAAEVWAGPKATPFGIVVDHVGWLVVVKGPILPNIFASAHPARVSHVVGRELFPLPVLAGLAGVHGSNYIPVSLPAPIQRLFGSALRHW